MQTRNIERFLQHALPRQLESLRLTGLDLVRSQGIVRWRSHFIPMDPPPCAAYPREFWTDMYWDLSEDPPLLTFTTVAGIAVPAKARVWIKRKVKNYNRRAPAYLVLLEHDEDKLSLYASIACKVSAEDLDLFASTQPVGRAVERFVESYEAASEILFLAWMKANAIGQAYRAMS